MVVGILSRCCEMGVCRRGACAMLCVRMLMLAVVVLACSGCYTNYGRRSLEEYGVYERHVVGAVTEKKGDDVRENAHPVIYRCGDEWYIPAFSYSLRRLTGAELKPSSDFASAVGEFYSADVQTLFASEYNESLFDARMTRADASPRVVYHKITPRMAAHLMKPLGQKAISRKAMKKDLRRAGGAWVESLPPGAEAVYAPYMLAANYPTSWYITEHKGTHAPWYAYVKAGALSVGVDAPLFVASFVVVPAVLIVAPATMFFSPLYGQSASQNHGEKIEVWGEHGLRPMTPQDLEPRAFRQPKMR